MVLRANVETEDSVITMEHFTKRFRSFTAVEDVSFTVRTGEVFALLGPNGSGKTTTMKAMVGLNVPSSGRVIVDGIDVQRQPREAKRSVSYLPQRVVFPDNLTAREVIRFYAEMRDLTKADADGALRAAQFNGFSDRFVGEFSGGMVQRLGLAVVALPDTPALVLDEPTANLDPLGVKRFREFIRQQKSRGKTIVFSSHLLAEVEELADRVAIFVGGRVVALESIEDLRQTFSARKTIEDMYLHYVRSHDDERS